MEQPQSNPPSRNLSRDSSQQLVFGEREFFSQAHDDDIHSAVWQHPENGDFITGSKDNTLKAWTMDEHGKITFRKLLRSSGNYTSWITALISPARDQIMYGARDGTIALLTERQHQKQSTFRFKEETSPSNSENQGATKYHGKILNGQSNTNSRPICKILNQARVTTLCNLNNFDDLSHYTLVGKPKEMICIEKHEDCSLTQSWKATIHSNDWVRTVPPSSLFDFVCQVYCILPWVRLDYHLLRFCVVIGSSLNLYDIDLSPQATNNTNRARLDNHVCVWSEDRRSVAKGYDRAHIAHLERLFQTNPSRVAGSCFDGTVRIFDIDSLRVMRELKGHGHRCWQSVEYSSNALITCADDGLLRLWDLRTSKVQGRVSHEGRVSCLLHDTRSGLLVTGSCPDSPHEENNKGTLRSDNFLPFFLLCDSCVRVFDVRMPSEPIQGANSNPTENPEPPFIETKPRILLEASPSRLNGPPRKNQQSSCGDSRETRRQPCHFFGTAKGCRNGNQCKFQH